jgi:tripartite-type tricarboxylate transporter receptor subunit TctC
MKCSVLALVAVALLQTATARAQNPDAYPARRVTIVVPFTAGGALDAVTRLVADGLRDRLGQPFVVENRAGATGSVGT